MIITDLRIDRAAFNTLLPALGSKADLGRWKNTLGKRSHTPAELAQVMRGEWNTGAEFLFFPFLLTAADNHQLPDTEAVARAGTSWFNTCVTRLAVCGLADIASALKPPDDVSHLSKEGREALAGFTGESPWFQGYVRAAAVHAQHQAALELLILEHGDATLTSSDTQRVIRDPVSGSPFEFDAAKRILTAPPATADLNMIEPPALPW